MSNAAHDEPAVHMGMPLPNGKLAIWLFLVTEIMFFTALIGTYVLLRQGQPTANNPWPTPHQVHLVEWMGAVNTFVLICSSLTVVLAHHALHHGKSRLAAQYIWITLILACVFLGIKYVEYKAKFQHHILPGQIFEKLDSQNGERYVRHVREQLNHIIDNGLTHGEVRMECEALLNDMNWTLRISDETLSKIKDAKVPQEVINEIKGLKNKLYNEEKKFQEEIGGILQKLFAEGSETRKKGQFVGSQERANYLKIILEASREPRVHTDPRMVNERIVGTKQVTKADLPKNTEKSRENIKGILEIDPHLHLSYSIPWGNMWASCYFAMTGFHALHVLGGVVVFVIMLVMVAKGNWGPQHAAMVEYTGLYWHFVDIVWIFLFPFLYLV